jgi:hypothetical protein
MRFSAPFPAASEPLPPAPPVDRPSLPPMRGQVFEAVVDASGHLSEALPLPEGTRVRVTAATR